MAQQGDEKLRDELAAAKLQDKYDQVQLVQNTDQCLAENIAISPKKSEERDRRMTREIEQLLNDHDITYAHTMTNLESRMNASADFKARKLDVLLNSDNQVIDQVRRKIRVSQLTG